MLLRTCLILLSISGCEGFQGRSVFDSKANQLLSSGSIPHVRILQGISSNRFSLPNNNDADWKVGDVYRDLDALEYAINLENSEENLQQAERLEMLDYCAQQRRVIYSDIMRFVYFPLAASQLLRIASSQRPLHNLTNIMTRCSDLHFWLLVVTAPLLLLLSKTIVKPTPKSMPEELKLLDPEYLKFVITDWVEPETNCQDYVQFLLEYWGSAVLGVGIMGTGLLLQLIPSTATIRFWLSFVQPIVRLGAIASLHQFQGQLFKLLRSQQPKPIGFFPSAMGLLVSCAVAPTPLAISFDLARVFLHLRWDGLLALHMSIITLSVGTVVRMNQKERIGFQKLERRSFWTKVFHSFAAFTFWKKPLRNLFQTFRCRQLLFPKCLKHWVILSTAASVGLLTFLSPCIHLRLLLKQFRIVYTHDLSLSARPEIFKKQLGNVAEMEQRMKWRFRIEWRNEKRLKPLLKEWLSGWDYWLFVKGTVREQLENEKIERLKQDLRKGNMVWEKVEADGLPKSNRHRWKADAMDQIARKHQEDYEKKTFEDPLGVAVQQALGIGLGFNFDHMRTLEADEKPSIRRLQARAAKSAIRRVQELYDADAASKELDNIDDPEERDRRAKALREKTAIEIKYLANRLTDLVPTSYSGEFDDSERIDQFRDRRYKRTSSHEYTIDSLVDAVPFTGHSRKKSRDGQDKESKHRDPEEFDKEFMEEYLKHLDNRDPDDCDDSMILS